MQYKAAIMTIVKLASFSWFGASLFLVIGFLATGSEIVNGWYLVALVVVPPISLSLIAFIGFSFYELIRIKRENH